MRLYYSPFACSLSPHIACKEIGLPVELVRVMSLQTKLLADGTDFRTINAKGQVPALQLDDGTLLTEAPAVLHYIADQSPTSGLLPPAGSKERYLVVQWLNYTSSEIHKACWWYIFAPETPKEAVAFARLLAERKFDYLNKALTGKTYLAGTEFTIADIHLVWALTLAPHSGLPLQRWPAIDAYWRLHTQRSAVQEAFAIERAARDAN